MNNIELEVLTLGKSLIKDIQGFLKRREKIDWEQRRYEVAKDILVHCQDANIQSCIYVADKFITALKEFEKNEKSNNNE